MSEAAMYSPIIHAAARRGISLHRNNVGVFKDPGKGKRWIRTGLCPGSSDLIGWRTVEGKDGGAVAQFIAIEVKMANRKPTHAQAEFLNQVAEAGGLAGCVHSVDEAIELLESGVS